MSTFEAVAELVDRCCGDKAREFGFRDTLIRAIAEARFAVSVPEDIPRLIAEALDAADKRREERAVRHQATQNLEQMRAGFANQLALLERYPQFAPLAEETRALVASIDEKLAAEIATNEPMIRESLRQARAAVDGRPAIALLPPGAQLIKNHGKRR